MEKKQYETYKKISTLGTGSFGTAYLVECQSNREKAVIKQIDIETMSEDERKETLREAKILEALNHVNIVRFREVYKTKKGKLCIVMDFADGGDIQSKIKEKHKKKQQTGVLEYFSEDQVLNWFTQICLAIKHCHDRKILHRDLKSQNIFLTSRGFVKLGDFGIARVLSNTRSMAKTVVGTPYYLPPEIIEGRPYSFKSDVWSLGILLYEMCALQPPFNATSLHQLAQRIMAGKYDRIPKVYSDNLHRFIGQLLVKDSRQRPSISDILKMSIIKPRIQQFLAGEDFKEEFSHTILHNKDVFKEYQRRQLEEAKRKEIEDIKAKQQREEERRRQEERARQQEIQSQVMGQMKRQKEEEEARKKMEMMNLQNKYKSPSYANYSQQQQQEYDPQVNNNNFMNEQYQQFLMQVNSESQYDEPQRIKQGSSSHSQSADDEDKEELDPSSGGGSFNSNFETQQELDIYSCDYNEFAARMMKQYGNQQFTEGFALLSKYKEMIYTEEGEENLVKMLNRLFPSEDVTRGFINYCISYIIVQNSSNQFQYE